jgi:calcineurin-like phosphoesterase family protein
MKVKWVIADLHLGQTNCFDWTDNEGNLCRPFRDIDHYWDVLKSNWNSVVADGDKVYILGDLAMKKNFISKVTELKGIKTLVAGNHDIFCTKDYLDNGIKEVRGVKVFGKGEAYEGSPALIFSHIPLAWGCLDKFINVHGHLHTNTMGDPKYICCCVEQTNFYPVKIQDIVERNTVHS